MVPRSHPEAIVVHRATRTLDGGLLVAAWAGVALTFVASQPARADQAMLQLGGVAPGSVSFTLGSFAQQGEALLPLAGTEFHIVVTKGDTDTAIATTGADGHVSFEATVTTRHAAASIEVTEVARTDFPLLGASCGHDFFPLLDWTDRPRLTLEVEPDWNVDCTFYHVQAGNSPKPVPKPTPPPTDADAVPLDVHWGSTG
jgi:hypothetical protein